MFITYYEDLKYIFYFLLLFASEVESWLSELRWKSNGLLKLWLALKGSVPNIDYFNFGFFIDDNIKHAYILWI